MPCRSRNVPAPTTTRVAGVTVAGAALTRRGSGEASPTGSVLAGNTVDFRLRLRPRNVRADWARPYGWRTGAATPRAGKSPIRGDASRMRSCGGAYTRRRAVCTHPNTGAGIIVGGSCGCERPCGHGTRGPNRERRENSSPARAHFGDAHPRSQARARAWRAAAYRRAPAPLREPVLGRRDPEADAPRGASWNGQDDAPELVDRMRRGALRHSLADARRAGQFRASLLAGGRRRARLRQASATPERPRCETPPSASRRGCDRRRARATRLRRPQCAGARRLQRALG